MKTNSYLFLVLALFVGLLSSAAHANAYPLKRVSKDKPETVESLAIHYVKGLLNARIRGARLGLVLRQLGVATGARFTLIDPETEAQPVFARVAALPFTEGVKRILDGFSYAIYPLEGSRMPAVTVLSTPRALRLKASAVTAEQLSSVYPVPQDPVPSPRFAETYRDARRRLGVPARHCDDPGSAGNNVKRGCHEGIENRPCPKPRFAEGPYSKAVQVFPDLSSPLFVTAAPLNGGHFY